MLQDLLHLGDARLGHGHLELRLLDLVVHVDGQPRRDARERLVPLGGIGHHAGDDQRRPRLVDQDRVDLVDDREPIAALHALVQAHRHVVAQVVEPELVVRAVRDVGPVGRAPLGRGHVGLDQPDVQPEEPVDAAHPLGVSFGEVVVDGDDVHALALERVQVAGEGRHEGLALAGLHLGDVALVQGRAAHQLDVEVALADRAPGGLARDGEGLGEQVVERLPVRRPAGGTPRSWPRSSSSVRSSTSGSNVFTRLASSCRFLSLRPSPMLESLSMIGTERPSGSGSGFLSYPRSGVGQRSRSG